jgi:hypothetical protein
VIGNRAVVAAAALAAVATAGCGVGPGASDPGTATIAVTRDYGAEKLDAATVTDPTESDTVIRVLDREADITTRYGGKFVQSINGIEGSTAGGRVSDWFFFVNGIESSTGAADVPVRAGDRIWWDYRDWTAAMRAPAVVGSWPEPFAQASAGAGALPVEVVCFAARPPCEAAASKLGDVGVAAKVTSPATASSGAHTVRMLVGTWQQLRADPLAATLSEQPDVSGVFARFEPFGGGWRLLALDDHAQVQREDDSDAGLVAALRDGDDPATWVVTGTDGAGLDHAVGALNAADLTDHYDIALTGTTVIPLPAAQAAE